MPFGVLPAFTVNCFNWSSLLPMRTTIFLARGGTQENRGIARAMRGAPVVDPLDVESAPAQYC
jgi:hypothetical protein